MSEDQKSQKRWRVSLTSTRNDWTHSSKDRLEPGQSVQSMAQEVGVLPCRGRARANVLLRMTRMKRLRRQFFPRGQKSPEGATSREISLQQRDFSDRSD